MNINFKLILRNLIRGKSYTVLNIIGLAIGFASFVVIVSWIKDELSYDKHLPDGDRTYRLTFETVHNGTRLHFARCWEKFVSQMPAEFPQIEELIRLAPYRHTALKAGEKKFYSDRVFATDSNFFKVFNQGLIYGDINNVLKDPHSAVISSSLAQKCYGGINPVGQPIIISGEYDEKMSHFIITGVMMDSPVRSHIHFDVITSFEKPEEEPDWAYVYLLLRKNTDPADLLAGIPSFIKKITKENDEINFKPFLQKISDIHLYSNKDREIERNGNITNVYLFIVIAILLLVISWINYYNLSRARLLTQKKQLVIQMIIGSDNRRLIFQSLTETIINVGLSFILATILLDLFNSGNLLQNLTGNGIKSYLKIWPYILIALSLSVLAGSLPVITYILSGVRSTPRLNDKHMFSSRLSSFGILMTMQFVFAIILLVSAITIFGQKKKILDLSPGKDAPDILVFQRQNWEVRGKYNSIRTRAMEDPLIKSFTASLEEPGGETLDLSGIESSALDNDHKDKQLYLLSVEDNFLSFFDIPLVAGRNFSPYNKERKGEDYILNEKAIKELNWTPEEAIGRPFNIKFDSPDIFFGGTVVGVVKDFNFTSLKQEIKPYVLFQKPIFYLCFLVRVDSARKQEAIVHLKKIWNEELPDYPFQYEFLDELYNLTYQKEFLQAKITTTFSLLAVIIICLGLISVTSVLVAQRTKEIGIRKVTGANAVEIIFLLNKKFIIWFAVAFIVSCPAGFLAMHRWLQSFAYKTDLGWWIFALSGAIVLIVATGTLLFKTLRAASQNPVEALRDE